jgi:ribosomal protein S18 acetylase RimI-like enzyme
MKPPSAIDGSYVSLLRSDVAEHRGRFLVAELAGQVVGYCTLFTHCDSSDETDEVFYTYAYVGDLAVDERHRGMGIGARLMSTCEMTARDAGQTWLRISVMAENDLARRFYARVGFGEHLLTLEKRL